MEKGVFQMKLARKRVKKSWQEKKGRIRKLSSQFQLNPLLKKTKATVKVNTVHLHSRMPRESSPKVIGKQSGLPSIMHIISTIHDLAKRHGPILSSPPTHTPRTTRTQARVSNTTQ